MFTVFVGSSSEARLYAEAVAELIDEHPLFHAIPWWHDNITQSGASFLESLFGLLPESNFGIFVATPDDLRIKRGKKTFAIRDNVLFEYGLFAGHLGRYNAVLFQIGETAVPSDLHGITVIRVKPADCKTVADCKSVLAPSVSKCLNDLLLSSPDEFEKVLRELRHGRAYLKPDQLKSFLADVMRRRLDIHGQVNLSVENLRRLLEKYTKRGEWVVGQQEHPSRLDDYIDLTNIETDDLDKLSASYARFTAKQLLDPCEGEHCATRIALHYKRDLKLVGAVVEQLRIQPAIVDLDARLPAWRIKGLCLSGESAIFLHDFTATGYTPLKCIAELAAREVKTRKIVSFFIREENLDEVKSHCHKHNIEFQAFCIQKNSGHSKCTEMYD